MVGSSGGVRLAVIGQHDATATGLGEAAATVRGVDDVSPVAATLAGSFHLIASVGGRVRAQGSISGLRRIFCAGIGGTAIAGDRADVLAALTGASIDDSQLAVNLVALYPPWLVGRRPLWHGVTLVEPDRYLALDGSGGVRTTRWWSPPEPTLSLRDGARAVRTALRRAVDVRTRAGGVVACDLSGLDSSSLCSLAVGGPATVVALTAAGIDPMDDDVRWATRTAGELRLAHHEVVPVEQVPLVLDGIADAADLVDEPGQMTVNRARFLMLAHRAEAHGARLHLHGIGGDELFDPLPAHLHAAARTRPLATLTLARQYAARGRWSSWQTLRALADRRSYRAWLSRCAKEVAAGPARLDRPQFDWAVPPRLPPWTTREAADLVGAALRTAAETAEPMAPERGRHMHLEMIRVSAGMARYFAQLGDRYEMPVALPYYDDRVIEACLSVDPFATLNPSRYKPLLVEAMTGIVPAVTLTRTTKADTYAALALGLDSHRGQLLALADGSRLERRGLVDGAQLREACRRPVGTDGSHVMLYTTVAVETWLRAAERRPTTTRDWTNA
jgi:asparagine synthase (glutamine-hydrolysing)